MKGQRSAAKIPRRAGMRIASRSPLNRIARYAPLTLGVDEPHQEGGHHAAEIDGLRERHGEATGMDSAIDRPRKSAWAVSWAVQLNRESGVNPTNPGRYRVKALFMPRTANAPGCLALLGIAASRISGRKVQVGFPMRFLGPLRSFCGPQTIAAPSRRRVEPSRCHREYL